MTRDIRTLLVSDFRFNPHIYDYMSIFVCEHISWLRPFSPTFLSRGTLKKHPMTYSMIKQEDMTDTVSVRQGY